MDLDKSFDPQAIESRCYENWESAGNFRAGELAGRPAFCVQLPPPNVTGTLHMGHAFNQTIMDALTRYHRMCGDNTLWLPGTDHAGIATQIVVERQLEARGQSRSALGRNAFVDEIWRWKEVSGSTITRQMRRLGASCDWSREYFTMDSKLAPVVTETFVRLYEQGLIYRGKRLVNWDPVLCSAVSDLEVEDYEVDGTIWEILYPFAAGPINQRRGLVVATTRPETMLGDVAVAVHPDDERYQGLVGKTLRLPLCEREIPIIADEYVDPNFGTGCVKITPAHDFNDYQVGLRHRLEPINILTLRAEINDNAPSSYRGMDRYVARDAVLRDLQEADLLCAHKPHKMVLPRCARTEAVVEPMLTDQWFVAMTKAAPDGSLYAGRSIAEVALDVVARGEVKFVPDNWQHVYNQWLNNIQDWCVSRQLWWGHQIPAWFDSSGKIYVARSEDEALSQARAAGYRGDLRRDEDVLDTWFSSALVCHSTLGWPEPEGNDRVAYAMYLPSSVLVTGFDIIFFWVARMVMMTTYFTGRVPFRHVYIHGLVRDRSGRKMSKSEGNTLDPVDLIDGCALPDLLEKRTAGLRKPELAAKIRATTEAEYPDGIAAYGADALRFTMASYATLGRDINFDTKRCEGYRNFCNKLWNASRFVLMNCASGDVAAQGGDSLVDRWIVSRLQRSETAVSEAFADYRFDHAAQSIYQLVWDDYCDWYIECAKVQLHAGGPLAQARTRATLLRVLETILRLAHPIIPFITETLWQKVAPLAGRGGDSIMLATYPVAEQDKVDEAAEAAMTTLIDLVRAARNLRGEMGVAPSQRVPLAVYGDLAALDELRPYLLKLGSLSDISVGDTLRPDAPTAAVGKLQLQLHIAVDLSAERERLSREIERLGQQVTRARVKLDTPSFVDRAPAAVVAQERERLETFTSNLQKLVEQLQRLGG